MDRRIVHPMIVALVAGAALFSNLGATRLWDRDEPRNAQCAAEMRARGDWIVPTFNGELRAHKPVLLYWLMLASYEACGVSEFAARLPSALLGVATALMTYAMGRRLFSPRAGLWAGIALSTCLSFDVAGRWATPDAALLCCVTAALAAFVFFAFPKQSDTDDALAAVVPRSLVGWATIYAAVGLAVLAKGPIGFALPVAVMGLFLLFVRKDAAAIERGPLGEDAEAAIHGAWWPRLRNLAAIFRPTHIMSTAWAMRPWLLVAVVAIVAAPWYAAVHVRTDGAFTQEFFGTHNFDRATSAMEGHRGPVVFYLGAMFVGFFPWSVFAVPIALEATDVLRQPGRMRRGVQFALCWAGVWIGAFSLVSTKLPNYITPAYPAIALLAGVYFDRWLAGKSTAAWRWTPWALTCLALVGVTLLIGLPIASRRYLPGDEILGLIGLVPLVTAAVATWLYRSRRLPYSAATLALGATAFVVACFAFAVPRVDRHQVSDDLVAKLNAESRPWSIDATPARGSSANVTSAGAPATIVPFRDLEPSMVYYAGRTIPTLHDPQAVAKFLQTHPEAFVVADHDSAEALRCELPADVDVIARRPKFLKSGEVVVLGRTRETLARLKTAGESPAARTANVAPSASRPSPK